MSIVRTIHNKYNPFVQINKEALWDKDLSLAAIGLWARLLSRPNDWRISVTELAKSSACGKDKIYKILNELIKAGYAYRSQPIVDSTKSKRKVFGSYDTYVFEYKASEEEIKKMFPLRAFPLAEKTDTTNKPSSREEVSNSEIPPKKDSPIVLKEDPSPFSSKSTRKNGTNPRALGTNPRVLGTNPKSLLDEKDHKIVWKNQNKTEVAPSIMLSSLQLEDLTSRLNGDKIKLQACFNKLSKWKIAKGRKNIDDYTNIINWVIGAVEKDMAKPKPEDLLEINKKILEKICEKYPQASSPVNSCGFVTGYNYIEFICGRDYEKVKITDAGFREQMINYFEARGGLE